MSLERELVISIGEDEDRTGWESTWITGKGLNSFLNHSTAIKLIADAGTNHSTRGRAPLKNPLVPSSLQIVCNASLQPLYLHQWLEIINKKLEPKEPVQHFSTVQSKPYYWYYLFKVPAIQTAWSTDCKYLALDPWTCSLVFKTSIGVVKKALRPANHQAYDLVSNSEP